MQRETNRHFLIGSKARMLFKREYVIAIVDKSFSGTFEINGDIKYMKDKKHYSEERGAFSTYY